MRRLRALLALLGPLCLVVAAGRAAALTCAECGMSAQADSRFTARLVSGAATLHFCDIGDLVVYIGRTQPREFAAAVRDFRSGDWLDAATAVYVLDEKTYRSPMGWGIAAFRTRAAAPAPALDFEALRQALR